MPGYRDGNNVREIIHPPTFMCLIPSWWFIFIGGMNRLWINLTAIVSYFHECKEQKLGKEIWKTAKKGMEINDDEILLELSR